MEEPVALPQVLQQRVIQHVVPDDLSNLGDHSEEPGVGQGGSGELAVVQIVGVTERVHAGDHGVGVERGRHGVAAPAVQGLLLLVGGEEEIAEVGEGGIRLLQVLLDGRHGSVGVWRLRGDAVFAA